MDPKATETARSPQATKPQQSSTGAKRGRLNGSELIRAKRRLDEVLVELQGFPQLRTEALALREKVLEAFVDNERKTLNVS